MNYEAWRISYQDSEQAARALFEESQKLRAENERLRAVLSDAEALAACDFGANKWCNEAESAAMRLRASVSRARMD